MNAITKLSQNAHWFLRAAIASVFIYHGLDKFPKLEGMAAMLDMPVAVLFLVAVAETIGGILLLLGGLSKDWMTRLGALMLIPVMLGAIFMAHWGQWSFMPSETHPMGGMEFQVTLLFISLYLLVKGNAVNGIKTAPALS